ncbi:hypothetical protein VKT23_001245 [Stygiomarasmius scandens]|uniref:Uncharacterized protein n=1 Tax=Marasmiellus scandens TaxID=2682957 RepID=A0ABR1K6V8_9AGAR
MRFSYLRKLLGHRRARSEPCLRDLIQSPQPAIRSHSVHGIDQLSETIHFDPSNPTLSIQIQTLIDNPELAISLTDVDLELVLSPLEAHLFQLEQKYYHSIKIQKELLSNDEIQRKWRIQTEYKRCEKLLEPLLDTSKCGTVFNRTRVGMAAGDAFEDAIIDAIREAAAIPDSPWSRLIPPITGPRSSEQYESVLRTLLGARSQVRTDKQGYLFWKKIARLDEGHVDTITPSASQLSYIDESLPEERQTAADELLMRMRRGTVPLRSCIVPQARQEHIIDDQPYNIKTEVSSTSLPYTVISTTPVIESSPGPEASLPPAIPMRVSTSSLAHTVSVPSATANPETPPNLSIPTIETNQSASSLAYAAFDTSPSSQLVPDTSSVLRAEASSTSLAYGGCVPRLSVHQDQSSARYMFKATDSAEAARSSMSSTTSSATSSSNTSLLTTSSPARPGFLSSDLWNSNCRDNNRQSTSSISPDQALRSLERIYSRFHRLKTGPLDVVDENQDLSSAYDGCDTTLVDASDSGRSSESVSSTGRQDLPVTPDPFISTDFLASIENTSDANDVTLVDIVNDAGDAAISTSTPTKKNSMLPVFSKIPSRLSVSFSSKTKCVPSSVTRPTISSSLKKANLSPPKPTPKSSPMNISMPRNILSPKFRKNTGNVKPPVTSPASIMKKPSQTPAATTDTAAGKKISSLTRGLPLRPATKQNVPTKEGKKKKSVRFS